MCFFVTVKNRIITGSTVLKQGVFIKKFDEIINTPFKRRGVFPKYVYL